VLDHFAIHNFTPVSAFAGGLLIGLAALWMLAAQGRIAGISGICAGVMSPAQRSDWGWRAAFLAGLLLVGATGVSWAGEAALTYVISRSSTAVVIAGVLVGFGTRMGGGCTSGHGICGLGRFSPRSALATGAFMAVGMIVATVVTHIFGGAL
jgi:uncharacterized membrane protein YedE/YeeE